MISPLADAATKAAARTAVALALRDGVLVRPDLCSKCGRSPLRPQPGRQAAKIHGHHEDYSRPLEVVWLCQLCHTRRHYEVGDMLAAHAPLVGPLTARLASLALEQIDPVALRDLERAWIVEAKRRARAGVRARDLAADLARRDEVRAFWAGKIRPRRRRVERAA